MLTSLFGLLTPLVLLFSLWVQKQWADHAKLATALVKKDLTAASADTKTRLDDVKHDLNSSTAETRDRLSEVKDDLKTATSETTIRLDELARVTRQTHTLVNSQRGIILKNMAILSRNHAVLARKQYKLSEDAADLEVASAAEQAADAAESAYLFHQTQQEAMDSASDKIIVIP